MVGGQEEKEEEEEALKESNKKGWRWKKSRRSRSESG